jgi:hypothetical protein
MEIAKRLGIPKMISGSFLTLGNKLRIEARIVDVDSGLQEAAAHVEGEQYEEKFFGLTTDLANKIIVLLKVPSIRPAETGDAAATSAPTLEIFKMLLEAEGALSEDSSGQHHKPGQTHSQPTGEEYSEEHSEEHSSIFRVWEWLGIRSAWAQDAELESAAPEHSAQVQNELNESHALPNAPNESKQQQSDQAPEEIALAKDPSKRPHLPKTAIRHVLEQYRKAYETKDLTLLDKVYDSLTPDQREANIRYFQHTQDLQVAIRDVDMTIRDNRAVVSYTREDQFVDTQSGKSIKLATRFTKLFLLQDGEWKMTRKNQR